MGTTVSTIRKDLGDGVEGGQEMKESLNLLMEIANQKKESFEKMLAATKSETMKIPIKTVLNSYSHCEGKIDTSSKDFTEEISNTLGSFVHGEILNGISSIMSRAITVMLGNESIGATSDKRYIIFMSKHGSLQRLDYELYKWGFSSERLTSTAQSVLVITYAISSVDTTNIDDNTVLAVIDNQYDTLNDEDFQNLKTAVKEMLQGGALKST